MTLFIANATGPLEDTRIGAVRLRVAAESVSTKLSQEIDCELTPLGRN